MRIATLTFLGCLLSLTILAQPTSSPATRPVEFRDVSDDLAPILKKYKLPGIASVVTKGDQIIASGVAGVRKQGGDVSITIHDQFRIGSCTHAMTATLCAILVEEGKLKWDSSIEQVFPEFAGKIADGYREATLEQFLTHHSGLPSGPVSTEIAEKLRKYSGSPSDARYAWIKEAMQSRPTAKPGTTFQYSSLGFVVAGAMCEKVSGFSWEDLMKTKIFQPLGMETAGFGPPGRFGKVDQPLGHARGNMPIEPGELADDPPAVGPAGTVHCSLPDWAKFISAHLLRNRLLEPETFQKLQTPVEDPKISHAMGWMVLDRDWADGEALTGLAGHSIWHAQVWMAPRKQFAVLVATNAGSEASARACHAVLTEMVDRFCPAK